MEEIVEQDNGRNFGAIISWALKEYYGITIKAQFGFEMSILLTPHLAI
jgi:hypothetical protein